MDADVRCLKNCLLSLLVFLTACQSSGSRKEQEQAEATAMNAAIADRLLEQLQPAADSGKPLPLIHLLKSFYAARDYRPVWSDTGAWRPVADSLFAFSKQVEDQGLLPEHYPLARLDSIQADMRDSIHRLEPVRWARADAWLSAQFFLLAHDLSRGRIQPDSSILKPDSAHQHKRYHDWLNAVDKGKTLSTLWRELEPLSPAYWELKAAIPAFVDSMDRKAYTFVVYPYKKGDAKDSLQFVRLLMKRLSESQCWSGNGLPDTNQLKEAVACYQRKKQLKVDGLIGKVLISSLNTNDQERFRRLNITLDRYRMLPGKRPSIYVAVNLPAYVLRVYRADTVVLESRVIIGKPGTPTPMLESKITNMVTYPTWTVPTSIISKEYLPKLKNNPGYLARIGLKLLDSKGQAVDPHAVNWAKYSKGIPYKVMQGSGDNNALGVMKFNFDNPYAVYLHDTNQRWLFKNSSRAYSHGCVRVQEWEKLAFFLAENDSLQMAVGDTLRYNPDSIRSWIGARQHKRIAVNEPLPLYIEYFSCGVEKGKLRFYDDIYGEDQRIRNQVARSF